MKNTKVPMLAVDDTDVYMESVPGIRFIAMWEQGTNATMLLGDVRCHIVYNRVY